MATSSKCDDAMSPTSLLGLPQELHVHLTDFLDWQSITNLRLSSPYFRNLFDEATLLRQHKLCAVALLHDEIARTHQIEKDFWEDAEESYLGYHSSSYTSSSLDPDLRAHDERHHCTHHELPCYHCLRWLPSSTNEAKFAIESMFSRGRSTGRFNLGGKEALKRICILCGIRTKVYPRGSKVKHSVICHRCKTLAEPVENWLWFWRDPKNSWQMAYYCRECLDVPEVQAQTLMQFQHEKRWEKYEDGMRAGKKYRLEKGKVLKAGKGDSMQTRITELDKKIANKREVQASCELDVTKRKRYCPVMGQLRLCHCDANHEKTSSPPPSICHPDNVQETSAIVEERTHHAWTCPIC